MFTINSSSSSNSSSSMPEADEDGGKAMIAKASLDEDGALSLFKMVDPIRELGLDLEQKQYTTRLEALSNPVGYARKRQEAFNEMVGHILSRAL